MNDVEMVVEETIESENSEITAAAEAESSVEVAAENAENEAVSDTKATPENLVTDRTQIEQTIEAIIFASPKLISTIRIRNLLQAFQFDTSQMHEILDSLVTKYQSTGFQLVRVGKGFQFRSHPEHAPIMQKLLEDKPTRLSASALEVLSIVAYKQPITRAEIDAVRGVDSGHLMRGLLEKNLVRTEGHAESPGRPLLYGTTSYFLEIFTLNSLDDLPAMEEFNRELAEEAAELEVPTMNVLAAEPDRGDFDEPHQETIEEPDFGMEERAREEVNGPT